MAAALVQAVVSHISGGTTTNAATIAASGSGNLLVSLNAWFGGGVINSVIDSASQTYTVAPNTRSPDGLLTVQIDYFPNTVSGVTSVTTTYSISANPSEQVVCEFSGIQASPYDTSNSLSQTSAPIGPTLATANAGEVLVSIIFANLVGITSSQAPWIDLFANQAYPYIASTYLIAGAAGNYNTTWNPTGSQDFCSATAAFKASSGGGAAANLTLMGVGA